MSCLDYPCDCCFAGLANLPGNTLAGSASEVLDVTAVAGAYTMAASGAYAQPKPTPGN
jgi:hypothetical protein